MPEKLEKMIEIKPEKEKVPESIITVYVIRHGESITDKTDPRRGLTETGKEQAKMAAERIAKEITQETDPETEIELRGYDSGLSRTNQTLIEAVKILTERGYKVYLPYSTREITEDKLASEEMEKAGLIYGKGPGIKPRIRAIRFPKEARKEIEEKKGEKDLMVAVLTTPPEKLQEMGMETPKETFERVEQAVESTNRIASGLRKRGYKRKIFAIATSHDIPIGAYLTEKLGISPEELGGVPNCEGFLIDFTGKPGEEPKIKFWGEELEKRMAEKEKNL